MCFKIFLNFISFLFLLVDLLYIDYLLRTRHTLCGGKHRPTYIDQTYDGESMICIKN